MKQSLANIFPERNSSVIDKTIEKITKTGDALEMLAAYAELEKPSFDHFLDKLITACLYMQGNRIYRGDCIENDRNSFVATLLGNSNHYKVKDQTRWSVSNVGKDAGEIDIFVFEKDGSPYTIIEGLNLDSLKSDYLILHLNKIFKYDTSGFKINIIIVFSIAKKFDEFCKRYEVFISNHNFQYPFISFEPVNDYSFTEIWIGKTKHERNGKDIFLYHILVNLN